VKGSETAKETNGQDGWGASQNISKCDGTSHQIASKAEKTARVMGLVRGTPKQWGPLNYFNGPGSSKKTGGERSGGPKRSIKTPILHSDSRGKDETAREGFNEKKNMPEKKRYLQNDLGKESNKDGTRKSDKGIHIKWVAEGHCSKWIQVQAKDG